MANYLVEFIDYISAAISDSKQADPSALVCSVFEVAGRCKVVPRVKRLPQICTNCFIVIALGHGPVLFRGADSTWLLQQILEDSQWCNLHPRSCFLHQRGKDVYLCWSYLINVICCRGSMMQACDRRAASVKAWLEEVLCVHLSSLTAVSHIKPMFTTR